MIQKELSVDELIQSRKERDLNNKALVSGAIAAAGASTFFAVAPAKAEGGVADVTAAVTSIAAVATAATAVVVFALAVRLGVKQVNRILTKG